MAHGRFFSEEHGSDAESAYVLNESAVQLLGWTNEEAIGKKFDNLTDESKDNVVIVCSIENLDPMGRSFVNGIQADLVELKDGDVLRLGEIKFQVDYAPVEAD